MTKARLTEIRLLAESHAGKGKKCVEMLLECCDEIEKLSKPSRRKISNDPPSLAIMLTYAEVIKLDKDEATACFDYYEKVGWVAGKAKVPIQSWEAALREWKRRANAAHKNGAGNADPARWGEFVKLRQLSPQEHKFAPEYLRLDFARWLRGEQKA
jgi:hypothetical protein